MAKLSAFEHRKSKNREANCLDSAADEEKEEKSESLLEETKLSRKIPKFEELKMEGNQISQ